MYKSILYSICFLFLNTACKKETVAPEPTKEKIPFKGKFSWTFEIPAFGKQKSSHTFFEDSIKHEFAGDAHTTFYNQILEMYDPTEKRCITVGKGGIIPKDGVYFVMFFKEITDSSMLIYKHECTKGKDEAYQFAYPEPNTTNDRGWNLFKKEK